MEQKNIADLTPSERSAELGAFRNDTSSQGNYTPPQGSQGNYTPPQGSQGNYTPPQGYQGNYTPPQGYQEETPPKEKYSTPYISNKTILYLVIVVALVAIAGLTTGSVALSEDSGSGTNANTLTANFVTGQRSTGTCVSLLPSNKYAVDLDYTITDSNSYIQFLRGVSGDGIALASTAVVLDSSRGISGLGTVRANEFFGKIGSSSDRKDGYFEDVEISGGLSVTGKSSLDGGVSISGGLSVSGDTYIDNILVSGNLDTNSATGQDSAVIGGDTNSATGAYSVVIGGASNTANGLESVSIGGNSNSVTGQDSGILAGANNTIPGNLSGVVGGIGNSVTGDFSGVIGGNGCGVSAIYSGIVAGKDNTISTDSTRSVIAGGVSNQIYSPMGFVAGGFNNSVSGTSSAVVGGYSNSVTGSRSGNIGGEKNQVLSENTVTLGGIGLKTEAGTSWQYATLCGTSNDPSFYPWNNVSSVPSGTSTGNAYKFAIGAGDPTGSNPPSLGFAVDNYGNLYVGNTGTAVGASIYNYDWTSSSYVAKAFTIQHPNIENRWLRHGCLEGPEGGVYYRGKGEAPVVIRLPDYATHIASDFTVQVTPIGLPRMMSSSEVTPEGTFRVHGEGRFHWTAIGERVALEPEPLKSDVTIHSMGPYSWSV